VGPGSAEAREERRTASGTPKAAARSGGEVPLQPKFTDDFAAKSADNGRDFRTRRPAGYFCSDQREDSS
jgi:hypothetical protein